MKKEPTSGSFDNRNTAFAMASDAMFIIETDSFRITEANPAATNLYGYSREEFAGMYYPILSKNMHLTREVIKAGYSFYSNKNHIRKNGTTFVANVSYGRPYNKDERSMLVCVQYLPAEKDYQELMQRRDSLLQEDSLLQNKSFEQAFIMGEESERMRIAREMHDHIGQLAVSTKFSLEKCMLLPDMESQKKQLELTLDQFVDLIREIRSMSQNVVTGFTKATSINDALASLISKHSKCEKLSISFDGVKLPENLTASAQTNIYRILEETLTNIRKHAGATRASITFSIENDILTIEIKDNGKGIQIHPPKNSFGLSVMKYRVKMLRGEIQYSSVFGKSFTTTIHIPLSSCYIKKIRH